MSRCARSDSTMSGPTLGFACQQDGDGVACDGDPLLLSLPPDVLYHILAYCDLRSLGALACTCRRLYALATQDYVWIARSRRVLATNQLSQDIRQRSCSIMGAREKCRVSSNWRRGRYREEAVFVNYTPYMPWLNLEMNRVWYTKGSTILCFARYTDGRICRSPVLSLRGHVDDVCRFACKDGLIVSGGRDGTLCGWTEDKGQFLFNRYRCHNTDVNSVDLWKNLVVSGSKDRTVKVWKYQSGALNCHHTFHIRDRVWSVAVLPWGKSVLSGSAGYNSIPPLQVFDLETGNRLYNLGTSYRNGAGILHIYPESAFEVLSCGYDTCVRLWDTRCNSTCVVQWEDPHDSAVYCVTSDHNVTVLSGTARHGLVRLWDKRMRKPVQMYYVGRGNSPVYCVTFDPSHMYVALDRSLTLLNFTAHQASHVQSLIDINTNNVCIS